MTYLKFDKRQLINLNYSLEREFIRSNRAGSYASSTITYCNTRKYHGLLVCPLEDLDGEKHVLLSGIDETIIQHEQEFHIGSRKYPGVYNPLGHKYIRDFHSNPIPTHYYRVGGVVLKKEILLAQDEERILLRYTLEDAHSETRIRFQPFLAFRQIHKLNKANMYVNSKYEEISSGIRMKLYNGYPFLYMQVSKNAEYTHAPDWYYNVEYAEEQKRGYDYKEDLFANGYFETSIKKGESVIFSAGTTEADPKALKRKFTNEVKKRVPRISYENNLENSAQQFYVRKGKKLYVTAGYPWFGIWGRDTFISLTGLSLSRKDSKSTKTVLDTMVQELRGGLFPNLGIGSSADVNSVDAPLWFVWSVQKYVYDLGSFAKIWTTYGQNIRAILNAYREGTTYGIKMRSNGLIYSGVQGKALTWMDALVHGKPVTPRIGFDVEINALWYNAVMFALEVAKKARDYDFIAEWKDYPELIKKSFIDTFWTEKRGYLADYVDDEMQNWDVRPNQVIAASLPYIMIDDEMRRKILRVVKKELLTPKGLRTLSPKNEKYVGVYEGGQEERDSAYHQGTVWPWLLGHFVEAYLNLYGKEGIAFVEKIFYSFEEDMTSAGIGTISEIYDGNPPHHPRGAISQAWSVAEVLRIKCLLTKCKNKVD